VVLLKDKAKAPEKMIHLCKKLQVKKDTVIARIKSDHGREFENTKLATFCNDQGTHQEFSSPKTPQQNGIVERKNVLLILVCTTILNGDCNVIVYNASWWISLTPFCDARSLDIQ